MIRRISVWTRLACASALALALATPAYAAPDAWITTKVKMALITSENAPAKRVDVDTEGKRIGVRIEVDLSRPLGIATYNTTAAIKNIQIKPVDGAAK